MCDTDRVHSSPDPDKSSVNAHRGDVLEFAATLQRSAMACTAIGDDARCDPHRAAVRAAAVRASRLRRLDVCVDLSKTGVRRLAVCGTCGHPQVSRELR
jgi:hypothetical protein